MPPNLSFEDWLGLIRAFQSPAPPFPEYSGLDHEDPDKFLANFERYFSQARTDNEQKTQLINKGLKDKAYKWWSVYIDLSLSWEEFREFFLKKYSGPTTIMRLQASLYSQKQGEKKQQQNFLLARRLNTRMSESEVTTLLLESLKPTLRRLVRFVAHQNFSELFEAAIKAEQDEADCVPRKTAAPKKEAPWKAVADATA